MRKTVLTKIALAGALLIAGQAVLTSCSDDETPVYDIGMTFEVPDGLGSYTLQSGTITFTELNTSVVTVSEYTTAVPAVQLPAGVYNIDGTMTVATTDGTQTLRTVQNQVEVTSAGVNALTLSWFYYNPSNTLVFGDIYFAGSLNAAGKNGMYDTYFTIYNNSDEVQYADGVAIVESKFVNSSTDEILTEANQREANFTAQAVYVVPGNGTDVPIEPGQSIKIVDQAIDWTETLSTALNHTDADFEWYDETTSEKVKDTDNPDVPNLDKWYCYSATIWIPSNQCNRSYALVRFPSGMTAEQYLAEYAGDYEYVNAATGKTMNGNKCYLIDYSWVLDGVNLCPTEKWVQGALSVTIDASYAAISEKNADTGRFGKKFARKVAGTSASGNVILQDTNDSAADFDIVSAK